VKLFIKFNNNYKIFSLHYLYWAYNVFKIVKVKDDSCFRLLCVIIFEHVWTLLQLKERYQEWWYFLCGITRPNFTWPKFFLKAVFVRTFYGQTFYGQTFYGQTFYGQTFYGQTFYGQTIILLNFSQQKICMSGLTILSFESFFIYDGLTFCIFGLTFPFGGLTLLFVI